MTGNEDGFFRDDHGRWRHRTPVTSEVPADHERQARRERRRRRAKALLRLLVPYLLGLLTALAMGCAHEPSPAPAKLVVLPEREGTIAAKVIGSLTGMRPTATTLPGGVIVVFQPADAKDPCLIAHETVHVADQREMGTIAWLVEYQRQLADCEARPGADRETCLRTIPLEQPAYRAQHECQGRREAPLQGAAAWLQKR